MHHWRMMAASLRRKKGSSTMLSHPRRHRREPTLVKQYCEVKTQYGRRLKRAMLTSSASTRGGLPKHHLKTMKVRLHRRNQTLIPRVLSLLGHQRRTPGLVKYSCRARASKSCSRKGILYWHRLKGVTLTSQLGIIRRGLQKHHLKMMKVRLHRRNQTLNPRVPSLLARQRRTPGPVKNSPQAPASKSCSRKRIQYWHRLKGVVLTIRRGLEKHQ
jgi:hypothetical protein